MEHHQVEMRPTTARRSSGDDPARFLQELRQLRDGAGLGPAELAARAHYPYDRIRAAEAGPSLPDLPVLSAYVRGCGGTTEEWEERWRSLTSAQTLPLLSARPAGSSTAASAGARIGSISPAADTPDPSIILAALDRVAEEMAVGNPAASAPSIPVVPPVPAAPSAPLPSRSGGPAIGARAGGAVVVPGLPGAPGSAGGKPGGGKLGGGKLGGGKTASVASASAAPPAAAAAAAGKPSVWETTTTRTEWGAATASTASAGGQAAADAEPATRAAGATEAKATEAGSTETGSTETGATEAAAPVAGPGVTSTRSPSGTPTASDLAPASASASARPGSATSAVAAEDGRVGASPASSGLVVSGWTGPALSRTAIGVAIALVICVVVAALAIFA